MPFQTIDPEYVSTIPSLDGEGLQSGRGIFNRCIAPPEGVAPVLPYGNFGDPFYPMAGIKTDDTDSMRSCDNGPVAVNDLISRCGILISQVVIKGGGSFPATAFAIELQLRATVGGVSMAIGQFRFAMGAGKARQGMVARGPGVLCTQFEVWGRTAKLDVADPTPPTVLVDMQLMTDRLGDQDAEWIGPNTVSQTNAIDFPADW